MALAITVTLQQPVPDAPTPPRNATGKSLARVADRLDFLARSSGVPQPSSFLSERREEILAQLIADGFDPSRMRVPPEVFHPATEGLRSVSAVLAHLAVKPDDVKQPGAVIRDLKAIEATLTAAAAAGVAFHLTRAEAAG